MPTGTTLPISTRPLAAGDTFAYAGNSIESFLYTGSTPNPSATISYAITQNVTNNGQVSFNGAMPFQLATVETDAGTNQTIVVTTDTYFLSGPYSATQTGFYTYGYSSSDTNGQKITATLTGVGSGNGLVDILPETQEQTWTNTGAQILAESESDGFSANRTTNADGTYTETDTYPQSSQFTPPPAALTATLVGNADGSGTYTVPLFGATPDVTFSYAAPAGGSIAITATQSGTQQANYSVPTWYTLPLYTEHDYQLGALTIPAACGVPAALGTLGNGVEQKYTKIDTVLGTLEHYDEVTYVVGGYAACVTLTDVTDVFYDYSGQSNGAPFGISFTGGTTPLEIINLASTVGLRSTNVSGAASRRASLQAAAQRVAFARANFQSTIERNRLERRYRAYQSLRARFSVRSHR
jgi:hypothetical protein